MKINLADALGRGGPIPEVGDTVEIGGVEAKVTSDAEAENACMVVCGRISGFQDDVRTTCSRCGAMVFHRPYAPKRPPKVCGGCMLKICTQ